MGMHSRNLPALIW